MLFLHESSLRKNYTALPKGYFLGKTKAEDTIKKKKDNKGVPVEPVVLIAAATTLVLVTALDSFRD